MAGLPSHLLPLMHPDAYPHPVRNLRLVETHVSWVLLTGEFAYKMKRPVCYPFVDLRSAAHRAFLCHEEVRLNRRFAPGIYLGVSRIVAATGGVRMAEDGEAIEYAVRMRQFPAEDELDRLVESGGVEPGELEGLGRDLAAIHQGLAPAEPSHRWGSVDTVRAQIRDNLSECRQVVAPHGTGPAVDTIAAKADALLRQLEPEIAERRERVRECHGDLHTRNLVRFEGRLVAFDCLEFDPTLRWIDVADELSFLWMDLQARRRPDLARALLSSYLEQSGDHGLCRVLRLYGCHRALVRAKVAALEASGAAQPAAGTALEQHRRYLDCARELVAPAPARLVLMSGLSGSGKTWLARQLAPALGAIHLRSDVERKRIAGLTAAARTHSGLGEGLYSPAASRNVHEHLARCADAVLAGRLPVIVDATFARREERARFARLGLQHGHEPIVVHCRAPRPVLESRIAERGRHASDPSEADFAVLDWQTTHAEPIATGESLEVIVADTTRADVLAATLSALRGATGDR